MGGKRPYLLEGERDWLLARLAEKPDLTLHALVAELAASASVVVACDTLWRFLRREGDQLQKKPSSPASRIALTSRAAAHWWKRYRRRIDPARLVFIDETWAKTNMTRTHGWRRRGAPLRAKVPHGHWRTMTFLAALRHDRIAAPCVIDGPINGESFRAYVEQVLVPTLQPGDIVVMDNLGSHKGGAIRQPDPRSRAPGSRSCRPTRPTSIRSSRSSPSSRRCSARPRSALSTPSWPASAACSEPSPQPNAPTTSATPDMLQSKAERL